MLDWTDEMVTRLKALSTEDLSGAQIADVLADEFACQITRSMVIAKLKRLKISRSARTRKRNKPLPPSAPTTPSEQVCTIDKLTNTTCRWPLWELPYTSGHYCGAKVQKRPYCEAHRAVAGRIYSK